MKATVEPLEGNKVKLSIEVDEAEMEKAIDAAFRKIARDIRVPGFRPGKAPRRLLEARVGLDVARQEALRESLPDFYADALRQADVDAIAAPEIDITAGQQDGPLAFDAIVEVRPQVSIAGYEHLQATVPSPAVTDEEVAAQLDRLRKQTGALEPVSRAARDGDHLTLDLSATHESEEVTGLPGDDYLYEVGTGGIVPELDEHVRGAKPGDILTFDAAVDDEHTLSFRVLVKDVKELVLPDVTDDWAGEASEFDTVAELEADVRKRIGLVKRVQAQLALRESALGSLVDLVADDPPEALVQAEVERRIHDLGHRLEAQGADFAQYLAATGQTAEDMLSGLREGAIEGVKADLALRSLVEAESIDVADDDVDAEIVRLAERMGEKPEKVRRQLERAEQLPTVRSDLRKAKALEWLVEHVEVLDEEGNPVERDALLPDPDDTGLAEGTGSTEEQSEDVDE